MMNIRLLFVLISSSVFMGSHSIAQQNKAKQDLCNYHLETKEAKQNRDNLSDRIEKTANKYLKIKKNKTADYKVALMATAKELKENDFCITEIQVIQNDFANPANPAAYTFYLWVNNEKLLGFTFQNKKSFKIHKIFESKEDLAFFNAYTNDASKVIDDHSILLGNYYNMHYPYQTLELAWDTKMNSMAVNKNGIPTYYFSTKELPSIQSHGFGFWQEYEIKIISVDEETILLVHDPGTKKELVTVYKKTTE